MRKPEEHNRISRQMKTEMKRHLEEKLLPFWKGLIDRENGGYFGYVDGQLQIHKEAVKGCILNSRILWFFFKRLSLPGRQGIGGVCGVGLCFSARLLL